MTQWYKTLSLSSARPTTGSVSPKGRSAKWTLWNGKDEKNYAILAHACTALRPGGKLLMTTLNALFPLFHSVKIFSMQTNQDGDRQVEI